MPAPGRGEAIGRYLLLSCLGRGGMGVVYAAYDPELDRKVALKLLLPHVGGGGDGMMEARLSREAQALAKLTHPNVVAIHDVGTHGRQMWIAMELVAGQTLTAWSKERPRSWQESLRVLADAARGVAAAHAVGLVHRDLKPDNVMIDEEGRVRVMDFGLAYGRPLAMDVTESTTIDPSIDPVRPALAALSLQLTRSDTVQGTPAYMAPEQWLQREVDAAADQFGWSVMAWELLHGERPFSRTTDMATGPCRPSSRRRRVPVWLYRIVERGMAFDPARRWPSMTTLLTALERGRTRARLTTATLVLGGLAVAGSAAYGHSRWEEADQTAICTADGASIADVWNADTRTALTDSILATGVPYATTTARTAVAYFDAQAEAWRAARTEACLDTRVRRTQDEDTLDRSQWCLDERRMEIAALVDELSHVDAQSAQHAVLVTAGLSPVAPCRDAHRLAAMPSLPKDRDGMTEVQRTLARAHALRAAGEHEDGLAAAEAALAAAKALDWPPLTAAANFRRGELFAVSGQFPAAQTALEDAYFGAAEFGALDTALAAATGLIDIVGQYRGQHDEAERWFRHSNVMLANLGAGEDSLERAGIFNSFGAVLHASGRYDQARDVHARALATYENIVGPDHPYVATSLGNLALVLYSMGDYAAATTLNERAMAIDVQALGADHPEVADLLGYLGAIHCATEAYDRAMPLYERALAIYEKALGPEHPRVATALSNLALAHASTGGYEQAKVLYTRVLAIDAKTLDPGHPDVAQSFANLAQLHGSMGEYAESIALHERALAIREAALGTDHPSVAQSLNNLAGVHTSMQAYGEALPLHERALAIWEKALGPDHPSTARTLENIAHVHKSTGAYGSAIPPLERALAIRERTLGPDHALVARSCGRLASVHFAVAATAKARALYERALAIHMTSPKPDLADLAFTLTGLARIALDEHRPAEAVDLAARAVTAREAENAPPNKLAQGRLLLAQALWDAPTDHGRDRERARALARQARDDLHVTGGDPEELAAAQRFLARR